MTVRKRHTPALSERADAMPCGGRPTYSCSWGGHRQRHGRLTDARSQCCNAGDGESDPGTRVTRERLPAWGACTPHCLRVHRQPICWVAPRGV